MTLATNGHRRFRPSRFGRNDEFGTIESGTEVTFDSVDSGATQECILRPTTYCCLFVISIILVYSFTTCFEIDPLQGSVE